MLASYFFFLLTVVRVLAAAQMNTAGRVRSEWRATIACAVFSLTLLGLQLLGVLLPLHSSLAQLDASALIALTFNTAAFIAIAGKFLSKLY